MRLRRVNTSNPMDAYIYLWSPRELIEPFNSTLVSIMANFAKLPKDAQTTLLGKSLDSSITGGSTHAIRTIARNVLYSRLPSDDKYEAAIHLFEELMRARDQFGMGSWISESYYV